MTIQQFTANWFAVYTAFREAGFDSDQSFDLTKELMSALAEEHSSLLPTLLSGGK